VYRYLNLIYLHGGKKRRKKKRKEKKKLRKKKEKKCRIIGDKLNF